MSSFSSPLAQLGLVDGNFDIQGFHLIRPQTEELLFVSFPDPRTERRWRLRGAGRGAWAAYFVRVRPRQTTSSPITRWRAWAALWRSRASIPSDTSSRARLSSVGAIPFFRNTLLGDAVYAAVLFGSLALAEKGVPALREPAPARSR